MDRAVRRLRVAAPTEAAARRLVTTLEDALRCASLPGDDARVVLVRRLALGRVARDASAQHLGRLIEQQVASGPIVWAEIDAAPPADAACVGFASALDARLQLALRLARGADCEAWYWPVAVPEIRGSASTREALRRIARAIATWPEARAALPAWAAGVVRGGAEAALVQGLVDDGPALLRRAAIAPPPEPAMAALAAPTAASRSALPRAQPDTPRAADPTRPAWLALLLMRAGAPNPSPASTRRDAAAARIHTATALTVGNELAAVETAPAHTAHRLAPRGATANATKGSDTAPAVSTFATAPQPLDVTQAPATTPALAPPWLAPTDCGGLLFLLPTLARIGFPAWSADAGDVPEFVACILRRALRRLRVPADDAIWAVLAGAANDPAPALAPPPAVWPAQLRAAWLQAPDAGAQAALWLAAARLWLQRHARLGLATLVRRPARLALTATHIDVHFLLSDADLRVRRAGLDIDPGWLPWFGRVVGFHFEGRLP